MKAEHRKELHTNLLADSLGRFIQGIKSRPSPTAITIGALLGLAILVGGGWWLYDRYAGEKRSNEWVEIDAADSVDSLQHIVDEHKGGMPNRIARFDIARAKLRHGLENYCDPGERDAALADLASAADDYATLAEESKDTPILVQEALLGIGTAKEALNDLEGARSVYQQLVERYKDSVNGKSAAERLKTMDDKGTVKFYSQLEELAGKKPGSP
jgi:hypothetical protein